MLLVVCLTHATPGGGELPMTVQALAHVVPALSNGDKLQLQPVLALAVQQDPTSPLQTLVDQVEVHWPPGTEDKADRLFNQLYECAFHHTPHLWSCWAAFPLYMLVNWSVNVQACLCACLQLIFFCLDTRV